MCGDILQILFVVLLCATCTKDGHNITVIGRVYDPISGEGISNCEIRLLKETLGSPGVSGGYEAVATVKPNAYGFFELNHTSIIKRLVGCYFDNDEYLELGWVEDGVQTENKSFIKVNLGRATNLDCQAVKLGQLIIHIENINCEGAEDQMRYRSKAQFEDEYSVWSFLVDGCYNGTSSTPGKAPIGYRYYESKVTRPSGTVYVYDTVYVSETGVAQVDILY